MDSNAANEVFNITHEENEEEDGEFPSTFVQDPNENDLYTFLNVSKKVNSSSSFVKCRSS